MFNKKPMFFNVIKAIRCVTEVKEPFGVFEIEVMPLLLEARYTYILKAKNKDDVFRVFAVGREAYDTIEEAKGKGFDALQKFLLNDEAKQHLEENVFS